MLLTVNSPQNWPYARRASHDPRPTLRQRHIAASCHFDGDDEDEYDVRFGSAISANSSRSPSLRPTDAFAPGWSSARASPHPLSSSVSTRDVSPFAVDNATAANHAEPLPSRCDDESPPLSRPARFRSFNVNARGQLVDCGWCAGRRSTRPIARSHKSRRATCPEIWLSQADDDGAECAARVNHVALRIYGQAAVGKSTLQKRMLAHVDADAYAREMLDDVDDDDDDEGLGLAGGGGADGAIAKCFFWLEEEEIELTIAHGAATRSLPFEHPPDGIELQIVVYSIADRDSFVRAAQILYRLHDQRRFAAAVPTIIIANKCDLQRRRRVTAIEGKMLANIYQAKYIEMSTLMSINFNSFWLQLVKKIQVGIKIRDRRFHRSSANGKRGSGRLVNRIMRRGRRFAKSCEELVARLASL